MGPIKNSVLVVAIKGKRVNKAKQDVHVRWLAAGAGSRSEAPRQRKKGRWRYGRRRRTRSRKEEQVVSAMDMSKHEKRQWRPITAWLSTQSQKYRVLQLSFRALIRMHSPSVFLTCMSRTLLSGLVCTAERNPTVPIWNSF